MTKLEDAISAQREAIARMLLKEADAHSDAAAEDDRRGDDLNCHAGRCVAANLRRLAAWIKAGEQHNL